MILDDIRILKFKNESSEIIFGQGPNASDFHLDTEDAKTSEVLVNNDKSILAEKTKNKILFCHNSDSSFYLIANIDVNELLKIANNIKR